ncbi:MAG: UDP-N-acetylglucosamine 2-epimerase [Actinoplanes sp.]
MSLPEVHLVGASRAEALRLAPVAIAMQAQGRVTPLLLATGPDPAAVDRTFAAFGLTPQLSFGIADDQAEAVHRLDSLWAARTPAAVVLRDSLAAATAAYWRRIPIVQVDAGRRFGELSATPGGGDAERRMLTQLATVHLAATPLAAMNLLDERVNAGDVLLTGGTVADATQALALRRGSVATRSGRPVLISAEPALATSVARAVRGLTARFPDLAVIVVKGPLASADRARLLAEAYLVITDDEDLPEETLAAGTPVLLLGDTAGHAESLYAGSVRETGPDPASVAADVAELLDGRVRRDAMAACGNPHGDGLAAYRVAQAPPAQLGHGQFPDPMPARPTAGVSR